MSAQQTPKKLAAKKAAVIGSSSKSRAPLWAGLACVAMLSAGAYWYFSAGSATSRPLRQRSPRSRVRRSPCRPPCSTTARPATSNTRTAASPFAISCVKSSDGVDPRGLRCLRRALAGREGLCPGRRRHGVPQLRPALQFTQVNEVKGGCNPAPLDRRVENGTVVIQVSDILGGKGYSTSSKKG